MRFVPLTILLTAGCTVAAPPPLLAPAPTSPIRVGAGPGQLALVDLNADRRLDLVARRLLDRRVEVLLGDGRGGFGPATSIAFDDPPGAMALGDLNGDGRPDLVVAGRSDAQEKIDVLLGAAGGAFARPAGPPLVVAPAMETYKPIVALADLAEDGHADVVFLNGRRHVVHVLLGDGRGGLRPGARIDLGPSESVSTFALGDLDGDGHVDLVSAGDAGAALRRGDGRGGFGSASPVPAAPTSRVEAVADLDGDGSLDLVLARHDATLLDLLLNSGRGEFRAAAGSPFDVGKQPYGVVVGDMDGDGLVDLAVTAVSGTKPFESDVVVLLGPRFVAAPGSPFPVGRGAYNLAVGDVDSDGLADAAASNFEGDGVVLLLGRAAGR